MVFRSMAARISPTRASVCRYSAVARSNSAREITRSFSRPCIRSKLSARQLALRFDGRQLRLLLPRVEQRQQSPARTACPDSNAIRSTVPGRSALTVTPCTAAAVPIALNVAGHSSCSATMVVTASGGGWNAAPCAIAVWICWNFTKPKRRDEHGRHGQHHDHSLHHGHLLDRRSAFSSRRRFVDGVDNCRAPMRRSPQSGMSAICGSGLRASVRLSSGRAAISVLSADAAIGRADNWKRRRLLGANWSA